MSESTASLRRPNCRDQVVNPVPMVLTAMKAEKECSDSEYENMRLLADIKRRCRQGLLGEQGEDGGEHMI